MTQVDNKIEEEFRPIPYFLRTMPRILASQRMLAYASEVGESFRPIVPQWLVRSSYALSFLYVGADVAHTHQELLKNGVETQQKLLIETADRFAWHCSASLLLPALSVHTIVSGSTRLLNKVPSAQNWPRTKAWAPTVIALASIPFIIHPLDHLTDFAMNNTIRRFY